MGRKRDSRAIAREVDERPLNIKNMGEYSLTHVGYKVGSYPFMYLYDFHKCLLSIQSFLLLVHDKDLECRELSQKSSPNESSATVGPDRFLDWQPVTTTMANTRIATAASNRK